MLPVLEWACSICTTRRVSLSARLTAAAHELEDDVALGAELGRVQKLHLHYPNCPPCGPNAWSSDDRQSRSTPTPFCVTRLLTGTCSADSRHPRLRATVLSVSIVVGENLTGRPSTSQSNRGCSPANSRGPSLTSHLIPAASSSLLASVGDLVVHRCLRLGSLARRYRARPVHNLKTCRSPRRQIGVQVCESAANDLTVLVKNHACYSR